MTKFGIDTSSYDGVIDWDLAKTKLDFVFIKAFEYQADSRFKDSWDSSKGKVPRGAYYFWRQFQDSPARTEKFLDTISRESYDGELPVVIDLEDNNAIRTKVFSQIDTLSERIKQVTKRYPIIYTGLSYWKEIGGNSVRQAWVDAHPLWISLPNLDYDKDFETKYREIINGTRIPFIPTVPPFKKVDFIQWTYRGKPEDIPGYPRGQYDKKAIDFNLYLGTDSEFNQLLVNSTTVPPIELSDKDKLDILWKLYKETH